MDPKNSSPSSLPIIPATYTVDILQSGSVIEFLFFLEAKVSESIPLARALAVEGPYIVVDRAWRLLKELLVEDFAVEEGLIWLRIKRPVEGDPAHGLMRVHHEHV